MPFVQHSKYVCAKTKGSRWSLAKPDGTFKETSGVKTAPLKTVRSTNEFCEFLKSIGCLRQSRGVSGHFGA